MKTFLFTLLVSAGLFSPMAMAQSSDPLMIGGKAGLMKPHGSENDSGITIGATIGRHVEGNFHWEADLNLGLIDGEIGRNRDWSINSVAGYGVFRTNGKVHFKAKAGVAYWDDDFDDDINLSMGVGIGVQLGRGVLDVEYTQVNDYVDYITVGYKLPL